METQETPQPPNPNQPEQTPEPNQPDTEPTPVQPEPQQPTPVENPQPNQPAAPEPAQPATPTPQETPTPDQQQPTPEPQQAPAEQPHTANTTNTHTTSMIRSNEELSGEEQETLKLQLAEYQRVYRQDMENQAKMAQDKEQMFDSALEYFQKNTPLAAANIVYLMQSSTSDGVRLNASKYIIECVRRGAVDDANDPVAGILKELMANPGPRIESSTK